MKNKRAFVTGASGFLGANLVHELIAQGWEVTAFHRLGSDLWRLRGLDIQLKTGSLLDPAALDGAIPEQVDAVFHLAAKVSFWRGDNSIMERDNVEATKIIVDASIKRKARRFIYTSSVSAYGFSDSRVDESCPKKGLNSSFGYFRTKALGEEAVLGAIPRGLDPVILNPANVLGPWDRDHWGNSMQKVQEGKMPGAPPGTSSFAHAVEVAKAHVAAVEHGRKGENYILGGTDAAYAEVFSTMSEILGLNRGIKVIPKIFLQMYGAVSQIASNFTGKAPFVTPELVQWLSSRMTYDSKKAVDELGYKTTTIRKMLEDCWESLGHPLPRR